MAQAQIQQRYVIIANLSGRSDRLSNDSPDPFGVNEPHKASLTIVVRERGSMLSEYRKGPSANSANLRDLFAITRAIRGPAL